MSPYTADVLDMDLFHQTMATRPRPTGDGKDLNILVVYYTRRVAAGGLMRCFLAHHEEMDLPGASEKLADDAWVHSVFRCGWTMRNPGHPRRLPRRQPNAWTCTER